MPNKEAEQAIKLGFSYNDNVGDVIDNLATEHIRDIELSHQLIKTLKLALKSFEKADNLEPNLILENGENTNAGKCLSYGFMGVIQ